MKKFTVWALLAMFVVAGAAFAAPAKVAPNASGFGLGAPATTNNDESCDIGVYPAATLLLPYFEVSEDPAEETTIFTITNVSAADVIAHVVLWTDYSYPVIDFNIFLTGYDVQSINLNDVIWRGVIAPASGDKDEDGTGTDISPPLPFVEDGGWNESSDADCEELPGTLDDFFTDRMQSAFTEGEVDAVPGTAFGACDNVGNVHANAVGYATIDVSDTCNVALPTDGDDYFINEIGYANVLIGDYAQVNSNNDFAQGNPMVHIRAIPEGTDVEEPTNFERTFYSRYQDEVAPGVPGTIDRRQPLPHLFAARWINGGDTDFETYFKVWREGVTDADGSTDCSDIEDNSELTVTETVIFDEDENGEGQEGPTAGPIISPRPPGEFGLGASPETALIEIGDDSFFVQGMPPDVAGWVYLNLDHGATTADPDNEFASQNWVVVSMRAEGRYSVDFDAAALGNGCTPPAELTDFSEDEDGDAGTGEVGPAANDTGCINNCP